MSRSLEAAVQGARARSVPWDAARATRVANGITSARERSRASAKLLFALGGLASAALCASLVQVSQGLRIGPDREQPFAVDTSRIQAPEADLGAEPGAIERPIGDGGNAPRADE
jgi:hypothetical protein